MIRADQASYDAVIIGAGIGGLVCGCYLAKAGMKVLIAERHFKPGGYCTSFRRKGLRLMPLLIQLVVISMDMSGKFSEF